MLGSTEQALAVLVICLTYSLSGAADEIDALGLPEPARGAQVQTACEPTSADAPLISEQGSAGIMYNLAEHPESIRAVAKDLMRHALAAAQAQQLARCANGCVGQVSDRVVFTVFPITYQPREVQQALCLELAAQTKKQPLAYGPREFASIGEFDDWMMKFTQGRGDDGKLLYEQCGGNCDPSYTFVIAADGVELTVDTEVFCGFTRDRSNGDLFAISTRLRPACGAGDRSGAQD